MSTILNEVIRVEMTTYRVKSGRRKGTRLFKLTEKTYKRINKEFYKEYPSELVITIQDLGDFGNSITTDISYIISFLRCSERIWRNFVSFFSSHSIGSMCI